MEVLPRDPYNEQLVANVHPADWQNPPPAGRYNLVAIGGGTAGLVSAIGTAGLGGRAALIERQLLGGDCLNVGCVPSKALIRAARAAHQAAIAGQFGVHGSQLATVDFPAVMERMRRLRAGISPHDSARRFRDSGVDVFLGRATFTGPDTLTVGGQTLRFSRAVIATGGHAAAPPIEGLENAGYLTNETIFSMTSLPRRLIIIGGGPIGSELAQAFCRFGSEVHVVHRPAVLLKKEEPDAASLLGAQFQREGIQLHLGWHPIRVGREAGTKRVVIQNGSDQKELIGDEILVAVGRKPNVEGLGLEAAGVAYHKAGIEVDDFLRTSNRRIYAAGDCCTRYQFTHAADAMARICIRNALFLGRARFSSLVIPRCTYTDPDIAAVGLTAAEAQKLNIPIDTFRVELTSVDRAVLDGEENGFAMVHTRKGKDQIVGATIVAAHAGEMIGEITLLMTRRLGLKSLGDVIHCYPTQVEVLKRIADLYSRSRLTPTVAALMRKWLAWRR